MALPNRDTLLVPVSHGVSTTISHARFRRPILPSLPCLRDWLQRRQCGACIIDGRGIPPTINHRCGGHGGLPEAGPRLKAESMFAQAQPFVMINACASAQPYAALTNRDSFPHRFVMSQACAVVGTLWPISGPIANEFSRLFYGELFQQRPIGQALLAAKKALREKNRERAV